MAERAHCPICEQAGSEIGRQLALGKYGARYLRCASCGHAWIIDPHWLEEAYGSAITDLDTGIVVRNLWLADATCALLGTSLRSVRTLLDHGGGSGLFVRLMRDRGHDAWWDDLWCENLLARGFNARPDQHFDLATAFELVEHLEDPIASLQALRARAPRILISTELQPSDASQFMQWHYLAPHAGQHIGFFTRASLQLTAERLGLQLSSNGRNLHLLAPERISDRWLHQLRSGSKARRWAWLGKRKPLTYTDAAMQSHQPE